MPNIYFPDVPEYQPLIQVLSLAKDVQCEKGRGYVAFKSKNDICIQREDTGLFEAVWFGALVGGFEGKIVRFDDKELRIE
jgi:hypothetical protein